MNLKTHLDNVTVSTVMLVFDYFNCPYETCVFIKNGGSEVVERYETLEEAKLGHEKWVKHYSLLLFS